VDWTWTQIYNPTGSSLFSTVLAAAPIVVLLGLLALRGWSAPRAAAAGWLTALAVAIFVYRMPPKGACAAAAAGALFGLFPIGWIVLNAVFLYSLTSRTGKFAIVKQSVTSLSADRRIQALLVAFSFGAFLEGAAGFGTPVAISSALMIGAGFPPLQAAGLALLANTAPVAFGALGTPITTLARVSGLDELKLSAMAGRQLPLFSLLVPAWMVCMMSGWRGLVGVWPAVLVSGGSFALVQFLAANLMGPTLVDVGGGLISLVALSLMLKVWQPAKIWRFDEEPTLPHRRPSGHDEEPQSMPTSADLRGHGTHPTPLQHSRSEFASAWFPWALLSVCVFLWGLPQTRMLLEGGLSGDALAKRMQTAGSTGLAWWERPNALAGWSAPSWAVPQLDGRIYRDVEVVGGVRKPEEAVFKLNWLSATGTAILVAALLSAAWLRIPPSTVLSIFLETLWQMRWPLATIAAMLAIAFTTRYGGIDVTLGLAFTHTGWAYPFFAPILGWLGVALTGSDTSCNALFGSLQRFTAQQLGLNPILICASNSTGGVMGKMIDAQSIVVSAAATGQYGGEGKILRYVFWHSVALASLVGLLTLVQAYVFPWMVPTP
jgi:lactate permease